VELAGQLDGDGAYPGSGGFRLLKTVAVLVILVADGNTTRVGPFRLHVQRLVVFVRRELGAVTCRDQRAWIERLLQWAEDQGPGFEADLKACGELLELKEHPASLDPAWQRFQAAVHPVSAKA
jgi:hypothetical protein